MGLATTYCGAETVAITYEEMGLLVTVHWFTPASTGAVTAALAPGLSAGSRNRGRRGLIGPAGTPSSPYRRPTRRIDGLADDLGVDSVPSARLRMASLK